MPTKFEHSAREFCGFVDLSTHEGEIVGVYGVCSFPKLAEAGGAQHAVLYVC